MVTLAVALETEEVVRTNEVPRRTRKSWGIRLPPAEVGPRVDVTVPFVAPVNATTCLEQMDQMDQCTGIKRDLVQSPTYHHGSLHVEDAIGSCAVAN